MFGTAARHSIRDRAGFILTDGSSAGVVNRGHALQAVRTHTGQNDAKGVVANYFCYGKHGDIHRRLVNGAGRAVGEAYRHLAGTL